MMSVGDWFLGSGPDRGQSPVEWGEIPFVHLFVRPSVPPSGWPSNPTGWPLDPVGWPSDPSSWPSDPSSQPSDPSSRASDPSSWPSGSEGQPAGSEGQPAGSEGQPEGGGWMDGWTNGISPHSTGLCPLSGPLPCCPLRLQHIKEAGQGYRWPHDAFWRFFLLLVSLISKKPLC